MASKCLFQVDEEIINLAFSMIGAGGIVSRQNKMRVHTNRREDPGRYSREVWGSDGLGLISHLILIRIL